MGENDQGGRWASGTCRGKKRRGRKTTMQRLRSPPPSSFQGQTSCCLRFNSSPSVSHQQCSCCFPRRERVDLLQLHLAKLFPSHYMLAEENKPIQLLLPRIGSVRRVKPWSQNASCVCFSQHHAIKCTNISSSKSWLLKASSEGLAA